MTRPKSDAQLLLLPELAPDTPDGTIGRLLHLVHRIAQLQPDPAESFMLSGQAAQIHLVLDEMESWHQRRERFAASPAASRPASSPASNPKSLTAASAVPPQSQWPFAVVPSPADSTRDGILAAFHRHVHPEAEHLYVREVRP